MSALSSDDILVVLERLMLDQFAIEAHRLRLAGWTSREL
jgi:hypothetical protein